MPWPRWGFNASAVSRRLNPDIESEALQNLISTLATPEGSRPVLRVGGDWFQQSFEFESGDIDESLRRTVEGGRPAQMRYRVRGKPFLVVGIPIPDRNASYYEATPLDEIEDTLGSLGIILASAGAGVTLASAGVGFWASRRLLRPLVSIGEAAQSIAQGDLQHSSGGRGRPGAGRAHRLVQRHGGRPPEPDRPRRAVRI